jgi:hypothetical protein
MELRHSGELRGAPTTTMSELHQTAYILVVEDSVGSFNKAGQLQCRAKSVSEPGLLVSHAEYRPRLVLLGSY